MFFKPCLAIAAALILSCAASAQPQTLSAAEAREDLAALYEGLQEAHVDLFASTPQPVFEAHYDELHARLVTPISLSELHAEFQRFAALARHGHARVEGLNPGFMAHLEAGGGVFPLDFVIRDGAVIVVGAPASSGIEIGDEIVSINDEPNALWLSRVTRNIAAETPELAYSIVERTSPYALWMAYGEQAQYRIEVDGPGGNRVVSLDALDYESYLAQPLADTGPDISGRQTRMITDTIAYLRPGPFYNTDATTPADAYAPDATQQFVSFIDQAFEDFIAAGAEHLILDLRDNPGGSNSYSDPVLAWIADEPFRFYSEFRLKVSAQTTASNAARLEGVERSQAGVSAVFDDLFATAENGEVIRFEQDFVQPREGRFEGEVYALINRRSYSNAVSVGAIIQDYGFGLIVGEATTDMASMYGAMEHFYLPNSGLQIGYPKAHIIRPNGDARLHTLVPDIAINRPLFAREDVRLQRLVERIEAG
jgi:C-terminal processing protease CtpA/Prc